MAIGHYANTTSHTKKIKCLWSGVAYSTLSPVNPSDNSQL